MSKTKIKCPVCNSQIQITETSNSGFFFKCEEDTFTNYCNRSYEQNFYIEKEIKNISDN